MIHQRSENIKGVVISAETGVFPPVSHLNTPANSGKHTPTKKSRQKKIPMVKQNKKIEDEEEVPEEVEQTIEEDKDAENILEETYKRFSDKLENCNECSVKNGKEDICSRHRLMMAKYLKKKYRGKLMELAKKSKDAIF